MTQIEALKAGGILSAGYDTQAGLEEFLLAQELYYDLKGMQDRSDDLFARAAGMSLSASQQSLVDQAQVSMTGTTSTTRSASSRQP